MSMPNSAPLNSRASDILQNYLSFWIVCLVLLLGCTPMLVYSAEPAQHKHILILNSYHAGSKGSDGIILGFSETLRKSIPDAKITIEYPTDNNHINSLRPGRHTTSDTAC